METNNNPTFFEKAGNWLRNSITLRLFTIGILVLLLLIPVTMIEELISEREQRQTNAQNEISDKWGHAQTVKGLVLSIPYDVVERVFEKADRSGDAGQFKMIPVTHYLHILPEKLVIKGTLAPEVRYRGIFESIIYSSQIELSGSFNPALATQGELMGKLKLNEASLSLGISDLRSIKEDVKLKWNDKDYSFEPGVPSNDVIKSGISVPLSLETTEETVVSQYSFKVNIKFNGSNNLYFVPLGKSTSVDLTSTWKNPSFDGAFLPDSRAIDEKGFSAKWNVLNMNRGYPQHFTGSASGIDESAFGVSLIMGVDQYQKSMRAAKYAVLFISLTFMVFFFIQVINKVRIHPIQYILVGLALCIFYALLISLSEHIYFGIAYLAASLSIVSLTTFYAQGTFKNIKLSGMLAMIMSVLYSFIFIIIQLEDFALLAGSIGLFIALALIMTLTRKIDWYSNKDFVKKND